MYGTDQILINIKMRLKFLINQTSKERPQSKPPAMMAGGVNSLV
jgi:hypothetical protein